MCVCMYLEKDKTSATSLPHSSGRGYSTAVSRKEINLEPGVLGLQSSGRRSHISSPSSVTGTLFTHEFTQEFTREPRLKLTALFNRWNSADHPLPKVRQGSEKD